MTEVPKGDALLRLYVRRIEKGMTFEEMRDDLAKKYKVTRQRMGSCLSRAIDYARAEYYIRDGGYSTLRGHLDKDGQWIEGDMKRTFSEYLRANYA